MLATAAHADTTVAPPPATEGAPARLVVDVAAVRSARVSVNVHAVEAGDGRWRTPLPPSLARSLVLLDVEYEAFQYARRGVGPFAPPFAVADAIVVSAPPQSAVFARSDGHLLFEDAPPAARHTPPPGPLWDRAWITVHTADKKMCAIHTSTPTVAAPCSNRVVVVDTLAVRILAPAPWRTLATGTLVRPKNPDGTLAPHADATIGDVTLSIAWGPPESRQGTGSPR